jgi:dipeptidyl aminopeptidase/acylaminoacyl peptidase
MLWTMDRDIRDTPLYREVEEHYRRLLGPAFGRISAAADPAPSPDGTQIAFTGSVVQELKGRPESRIGLVDLETRTLRQITHGPGDDRLPSWSPDGRRVAFLSDRAERGRFQPYLLDSESIGEALASPDVPGTVEWLCWSPDGSRLLLGVAGLGADQPAALGSGTTGRRREDEPTWLPDVESSADAEREWRRLWILEPSTGSVTALSRPDLNIWEAAWCGDEAVVAIVSYEPGEEAWYSAPLALIDVGSGKERVLVRSDIQLGLPTASSDGSYVAVTEALCSDRLAVAGDLLLVDPKDASVRRVDTAGVDVTGLAWRDDQRLVYLGLRGLTTVAGEVHARSGAATELWSSHETCGDWYPAGAPLGDDAVAVVLHSYERAPEIALLRGGKAETVASLAHDGSRFLQETGGRSEEISWGSPDGLEIQGLLVLPEGQGPHPLIVSVHGGPVWASRSAWLGARVAVPMLVSRGYAVLFPNPRGSSGRGTAFARMVVGDMGGADADDILAGVDALVGRGIVDPARVGVTGGSYGGFMSAWLVTRTDRLAAAVAISPVTDWYSQHWNSNIGSWDSEYLGSDPTAPGGPYRDRSPVMFADRVSTPTLLTAGLLDKCTPPGQAVEFYRAIRERGIDSAVVLYPEEGHGVRGMEALIDLSTRMLWWFERHMPARPEEPHPD